MEQVFKTHMINFGPPLRPETVRVDTLNKVIVFKQRNKWSLDWMEYALPWNKIRFIEKKKGLFSSSITFYIIPEGTYKVDNLNKRDVDSIEQIVFRKELQKPQSQDLVEKKVNVKPEQEHLEVVEGIKKTAQEKDSPLIFPLSGKSYYSPFASELQFKFDKPPKADVTVVAGFLFKYGNEAVMLAFRADRKVGFLKIKGKQNQLLSRWVDSPVLFTGIVSCKISFDGKYIHGEVNKKPVADILVEKLKSFEMVPALFTHPISTISILKFNMIDHG